MKKNLSILLVACGAMPAFAAQFKPDGGGNLDDLQNWTGTGTMAVVKQLSGPLTLSTSPTSMPEGATSLCFYSFPNTCNFGDDGVLNLGTVPLQIEHGAEMTLVSGKITGKVFVQESGASETQYDPATLRLTGPHAVIEPSEFSIRCYKTATSAKKNNLFVEAGAKLVMSDLPFRMYGGFNAGYALFTGEGSSLQAASLWMGEKYDTKERTYTGWDDKPGVSRTVEFAKGATGSIAGSLYLGDVSGGNVFKVSSGACVDVGGALYFGPDKNLNDAYNGCTNNTLLVDGGTLNVSADVMTGRQAAFGGSRIEVTNGGQLAVTATGEGHSLQVGIAADGDSLLVSGMGSLVSLPSAKLFVGGRAVACGGNCVTVTEGGRIESGMDTYLGYLHGADNRLEILDGASFTNGANFYLNGPRNILKVEGAGSTFSVANYVYSDVAATNAAIICGPGSVFSAPYMRLKGRALLSANRATVNVPHISFAEGSRITLTNSTMTLTADVPNAGGFGSTDSSLELHGGSVLNVNYRWTMVGTNFTVRIDDSTLDASGISSNWLITGQSSTDGERHFIFEGARPYLKTASNGFYLRGSAIDLTFNLGAGGFPTDRPVIDVQGNGEFKADTNLKSLSLVQVNVAADCPLGTYELMKGKNAGTFLNADRYVVSCGEGRRARLIRETDSVSVSVSATGLLLFIR